MKRSDQRLLVVERGQKSLLKEGGTQKNNFSENLTVDTSGGFEPGVQLAEHQKRYQLRYAARKARRLDLPICAGAFFSLNTSLNTTRVPTSFKVISIAFKGSLAYFKAKHEKNNFSVITKIDTSGGFELRARLAHHQTRYRLR